MKPPFCENHTYVLSFISLHFTHISCKLCSLTLTGSGPSSGLRFRGDEDEYELWEEKFCGYLMTRKLHEVLTSEHPDTEKNRQVYGELVQLLDDRSLSLIIRNAKHDGKKAIRILRDHYLGKGMPRVLDLYSQLSTLQMTENEVVTDYVVRAETAATSLTAAGENVSDRLLIAMVLKGLPPQFHRFQAMIRQKKTLTFAQFKTQLHTFEESEKPCKQQEDRPSENVMNLGDRQINFQVKFFARGKLGHISKDCRNENQESRPEPNRPRGWCSNCKSATHFTTQCQNNKETKKDTAKNINNEAASNHRKDFAFCTYTQEYPNDKVCGKNLLIDTGATAHIISEKEKFVSFDENFNPKKHTIELADGSRTIDIVQGRGDACVMLRDSSGKIHKVNMEGALYVPTYEQNIISVQCATQKGVTVTFTPECAKMIAPDGTVFDIEKKGRLYYLNNVKEKNSVSHTVVEWHKILGHCNMKDILKLEGIVYGMCISSKEIQDCETCSLGKTTQYWSREPDARATDNLELIHCDLAGPINVIGKGGYKFAITFVDDYSGFIMVYLLKNKSGTTQATEKFLADISSFGRVKCFRTDNGTEFTSSDFSSLMTRNKIKHEFSTPYSPHQNGNTQRSWRPLFEMAKCLLIEAGLPKPLWPYALKMSACIRNRCFNSRTGSTPQETLIGEKPNFSDLHVFGDTCYIYQRHGNKSDARSVKGIFLGYDRGSPAYVVYLPNEDKVKRELFVKFIKCNETYNGHNADCEAEVMVIPPEPEKEDQSTSGKTDEGSNVVKENGNIQGNTTTKHKAISRYPRRDRKPPNYRSDFVTKGNKVNFVDTAS